MWLFQLACVVLLAASAWTQEFEDCGADVSTVDSTEGATDLATSLLNCSNGEFAVEWVGEVVVEETILVTGGTSLNITGAGPGAIADGGNSTQLSLIHI